MSLCKTDSPARFKKGFIDLLCWAPCWIQWFANMTSLKILFTGSHYYHHWQFIGHACGHCRSLIEVSYLLFLAWPSSLENYLVSCRAAQASYVGHSMNHCTRPFLTKSDNTNAAFCVCLRLPCDVVANELCSRTNLSLHTSKPRELTVRPLGLILWKVKFSCPTN